MYSAIRSTRPWTSSSHRLCVICIASFDKMDQVTFLFLNRKVGGDMTNAIASFVGGPRRAPRRAAAMAGTIRRRAQEVDFGYDHFESLLVEPAPQRRITLDDVKEVIYRTVDPSLVAAHLFEVIDLSVEENEQELLFNMWTEEELLADALPPLERTRLRTLEEEESVDEAAHIYFDKFTFF